MELHPAIKINMLSMRLFSSISHNRDIKSRIPCCIVLFVLIIVVGCIPLLLYDSVQISLWFNAHHTYAMDVFFSYITILGENVSFLVVVMIFYLAIGLLERFVRRSGELVYMCDMVLPLMIIAFVVSSLIVQLFKRVLVHDNFRPIVVISNIYPDVQLNIVNGVKMLYNYSFPSGHSSLVFMVITVVLLCYNTKFISRVLLVLFAVSIAVSRVYLLQHLYRDVYAGAIIGMASAMVAWRCVCVIVRLRNSLK